jgi:hypothetical protein
MKPSITDYPPLLTWKQTVELLEKMNLGGRGYMTKLLDSGTLKKHFRPLSSRPRYKAADVFAIYENLS